VIPAIRRAAEADAGASGEGFARVYVRKRVADEHPG
jgi:hypothetical protein